MVIVVAVIGTAAVVGGLRYRDRQRQDDATKPGADSRPALIEGFCADPKPLTSPGTIATFTPGAGAVAFVEVPQPASSTDPVENVVAQVSPTVGDPTLQLAASVDLVSLAVCVDQTGSTKTGTTCRYELTNPSSVGERDEAPLLETSYRVRVMELRTGKAVATGNLTSSTEACPEYAYIGGKGVSAALTPEQVLGWVGEHLAGGQPG